MSLDIRLPNITGVTETEQLQQIRSYLYQLAPQLNWALSTLEGGPSSVVVQKTGAGAAAEKEKDREDNFNEIKGLIIKSADVVSAFYAEIKKKLDSVYLAQSDFGTYFEENNAEFTANSTLFQIDFSNYQQISQNAQNAVLNDSTNTNSTLIRKSEAYIKIGMLEENTSSGNALYGIEIGQEDATESSSTPKKYARFTSNSLTFYNSSGVELATFSDSGMEVQNAIIKENLQLGGYVLDTEKGLAFKWVGKE